MLSESSKSALLKILTSDCTAESGPLPVATVNEPREWLRRGGHCGGAVRRMGLARMV
jgi:hypothetical protein